MVNAWRQADAMQDAGIKKTYALLLSVPVFDRSGVKRDEHAVVALDKVGPWSSVAKRKVSMLMEMPCCSHIWDHDSFFKIEDNVCCGMDGGHESMSAAVVSCCNTSQSFSFANIFSIRWRFVMQVPVVRRL